jgi:16S rRNA (guanine1207-N2)-methyltransferase
VIRATIGRTDFRFETAPGLFSPRAVDAGTLAMLTLAAFAPEDKVLDLGCGYGPVGIFAASLIGADRVWLLDKDPTAVAYAARNLALNGLEGASVVLSDGFANLDETGFSQILLNPPFHADFAVPRRLIEKGFNRLAIGGRFWVVVKRDAWYRNKLRAIFGGVRAHAQDGYVVFEAMKTASTYANRA